MPDAAICPHCERKVRVPDSLVGKRIKCPGCAKAFLADAVFEDEPAPAKKTVPDQKKTKPALKAGATAKTNRPAPRQDDDEDDEERPVKRKKSSKKQGSKLFWPSVIAGSGVAVVVLVGLVWIVFFRKEGLPAPPTGHLKPSEPQYVKQDITNIAPKFSLSAEEYLDDTRNQQAAKSKYGDSVIELTGTVFFFGINRDGIHWIMVGNRDRSVQCHVAEDEPWVKVSPGQSVKLKGRFPKEVSSRSLYDCILLEVTGAPVSTLTAEQLAGEYAAGQSGGKYAAKFLYVTGEVVEKKQDRGETIVSLKGGGATMVRCRFTNEPKRNPTDAIMAGQQVKVLGQYEVTPQDKAHAEISYCVLVTKTQ